MIGRGGRQAETHLEKDGGQKFTAGALQLLLRGSVTALLIKKNQNNSYELLLLFHNKFHWESTELSNRAVMDFCISLLLVQRVSNARFGVQAYCMALE